MEKDKHEKNISQADLVGEKKTKITQDYEFIKEIGSGKSTPLTSRRLLQSVQGETQIVKGSTLRQKTEQERPHRGR
jgi:hypothetical protein